MLLLYYAHVFCDTCIMLLTFLHVIISHMQRLAAGEWFTARVSSCGLFHIAYSGAPETFKTELRTIYSQLCQDDMPMVRRSAATNLGKFAATIEPAHLKTEIIAIFDELTQDGMLLSRYLTDLVQISIFCFLVNDCFKFLQRKHFGFCDYDPEAILMYILSTSFCSFFIHPCII